MRGAEHRSRSPAAWTVWCIVAAAALPRGLPAQEHAGSPAVAAAPRELLNSERIEQRYGSYGVEVLASDAGLRVSSLFSGSGAERICRTFAVVRYPQAVDPRLEREHRSILAGGSIGAVFAAHGWRVAKTHLHYATIDSTPHSEALMGGLAPSPLALHIYMLEVARDRLRLPYAVLAEVHHPDYLGVADLREIYGEPEPPAGDATIAEMLALAAQHLGRE